ncbi:uncharacterized protein PV07_02635 [Cladophialophora immunda]|uniref:Uncharacterized protein n=1 Tax=Cladophialophora immunda TaxID=569365 RepID=A0A0D2D5L3_9EURO|nr:uncharacterized protein PV07_02635 [Cladophialophora immunda]KIW30944.1 hypothetical protein PV07_02635 [Cladophialophora immunda]
MLPPRQGQRILREQRNGINEERSRPQRTQSDTDPGNPGASGASFGGGSHDALNASVSDEMPPLSRKPQRRRSTSRKRKPLQIRPQEHQSDQQLDAPEPFASRKRKKSFNSSGAAVPSTHADHARRRNRSTLLQKSSPHAAFLERLCTWASIGLETLGNFVNICLAASRNVTTSPWFGFTVVLFLILLICMVVLATIFVLVSGVQDSYAVGKGLAHGAYSITVGSAAVGNRYLAWAKHRTLDGAHYLAGAVSVAGMVSKSILCSYPDGETTVQWLGYSCEPMSPEQDIFDTLNKTAIEIGQWANVSSLILPHSTYLRNADLALAKQQLYIKLNPMAFPEKDALDQTMTAYGKGILMAGRQIFTTIINTEFILFMMLAHLNEAERRLKYVSGDHSIKTYSLRSWHTTYQVTRMLSQLLTDLDARLVELIQLIEQCRDTFELVERDGATYGKQIRDARQYVQAEIDKKGILFDLFYVNSPQHQMRESLTAFVFPLPEILEHLRRARDSLWVHQQSLHGARVNFLSMHNSLTTSGPNVVLQQLHGTIQYLASTSANLEIERTRYRKRTEAERISGQHSLPKI